MGLRQTEANAHLHRISATSGTTEQVANGDEIVAGVIHLAASVHPLRSQRCPKAIKSREPESGVGRLRRKPDPPTLVLRLLLAAAWAAPRDSPRGR